MSFYRIQTASLDTALLLDPDYQWSEEWAGRDLRRGVSTCASIDDLARYFALHGGILDDDCVIVELEAHAADELDVDHADGARLVIPTRIVSARPIDDEFYTLVGDHFDAL